MVSGCQKGLFLRGPSTHTEVCKRAREYEQHQANCQEESVVDKRFALVSSFDGKRVQICDTLVQRRGVNRAIRVLDQRAHLLRHDADLLSRPGVIKNVKGR